MGISLKKENWYGFIPQQYYEASVENYTNHGLGPTKSSTSSLMSPTVSKLYEHTGNVLQGHSTRSGRSGHGQTLFLKSRSAQFMQNCFC